MRHKSGRQRRGSPKNTQRLFFISVRVGHRAETSGALCMPISRRRGVNTLNSTRLDSFVYRDNAVSPLKDVEVFLAVDATTRPVVPAAAALECAPTRQLAEESVMRDQLPLFFFSFLRTQEHTASFHESAQARVYHLELAHHISQQADSVQRR